MTEVLSSGRATSPSEPIAVGFLGLGRMGRPMAANVARAGFPLSVFNRTNATATRFAEALNGSVTACRTPVEVARRSDVVITMLADGAAVRDVYLAEEGLLAGLRPGSLAVEMSTISPDEVRDLKSRLEHAGVLLIDAPVSGSVALAESAALTIMAAGDPADVESVRGVLETMGSSVVYIGPSGRGAAMKLAVNAVVYGLNQALSEGLVLAEKAGIDRATAYAIFANSAVAAPFVHYRRDAFERPEEVPVAFRLALARKDLDLILGLAEKVGAEVPQAVTNAATLEGAGEAGFDDEDVSTVARYLRGEKLGPRSRSAEGGVSSDRSR